MSFPEFEYLGPYKVERTLGRGGMGTVYKGIHAQSGEAVAIKVIATGIANNMRFRRRFAAEVETLKRLKHPHIVQLVGYGEEQGLLFYSMEYVDGHSLHDHLRQHSRLPWAEVIQIGIETTSALKHAHDFGIIHRDLKPANLMLNKVGRIKLTDFGIAKLFGSTDMTAAGSVIGTADYMPPEQAEGKAVTIRSDLYSLGGVLYALLAGKAPFGGKSVPEVLYSVRYNSVPDLRERAPDVPRELAELIHQLLEKDPGQRPPTALVVGNRLKSLQQGLKRLASGQGPGTHGSERSPTKPPGTQLTSLDLSDVDDQELRLTSTAHSHDRKPVGEPREPGHDDPRRDPGQPPLGTHELQTLVAPEGTVAPPSDEKFTAVAGDGRSPQGNSAEASADFQSAAPSSAPITSGGPSHFTPIGDKPTKTTSFDSDDEEQQPAIDWLHYGSVAGLVCLLLGCIGLGWWLLRPASANYLYDEVSAAVASGDDAQLLQASGLIDEFLTRFPDDERSAELQALSDEVELARWSKVLQRRASRSGGAENLSVIEQGFLQGVQLLSEDSQAAQFKLAAFVEIFGGQTDLARNDQRLVDLAQYALRVGTTRVKMEVPASAVELQNLISSAEASMTSTQLTAFYRNLINLYGDLPWAKEHIERIRTLLEAGS
jgi:serine/threonine protein kinase